MTFGVSGHLISGLALGAALVTGSVSSGQAAPVPVSGIGTVAGSPVTTDVRYYGRGGGFYRGGYGRGFGGGPFVAGAALGLLGGAALGYGYGGGYGYGYPAYGYGGYGYGYGYPVAYGGFYGPGYGYGYGRGYYGRGYGYGYGRGYGYGGRRFGYGGGRGFGGYGGGFRHAGFHR